MEFALPRQEKLSKEYTPVRSGGNVFITKPVLAAEIALLAVTFSLRGRLEMLRASRQQECAVG
jgi:hypothetical protein